MCLWFDGIVGIMLKLSRILKVVAYFFLMCLFLYFVSPYFQQKYISFVSSPVKNDDAVMVIVTNPTRLRDLVVRSSVSDDCMRSIFPAVACRGNYVTLSGSLEVYASVYGDIPGQVDRAEMVEVGVYVYSESDEINRFLESGCSNLRPVDTGWRKEILKGTSREGGGGELYGLGDGYFSAVSVPGMNPGGFVKGGCPYEGGLFSVNGENVEVLLPHISYEFKNRVSSDVREKLYTAARAEGVPPLNSLRQDCSLFNDHVRHEYLSRSDDVEISDVIISSQVCSQMSDRYRVDRAYADSVKDESYLFDRGLPYVNEVQVPVVPIGVSDPPEGELNSVYVRFHDEHYSDNETMALFWAALIGSSLISWSSQGVSWLICSVPNWRSSLRKCGNEFYEEMKEKGMMYGRR